MSKLKVNTPIGTLHWGAGGAKNPVDNIVATPIIGNQWRKAPKGSKFNLELVVCRPRRRSQRPDRRQADSIQLTTTLPYS